MTTTTDVAAAQRHTVRTLVATQAIGGIGLSAAIAVGALLAKDVTGSRRSLRAGADGPDPRRRHRRSGPGRLHVTPRPPSRPDHRLPGRRAGRRTLPRGRSHPLVPLAPRRDGAPGGGHRHEPPEPVCRDRPRAPGPPRARPQHGRVGHDDRLGAGPEPQWPGRGGRRVAAHPRADRAVRVHHRGAGRGVDRDGDPAAARPAAAGAVGPGGAGGRRGGGAGGGPTSTRGRSSATRRWSSRRPSGWVSATPSWCRSW